MKYITYNFSLGDRPVDEGNMISIHGRNIPAPPKAVPPPIPGMIPHKNVRRYL